MPQPGSVPVDEVDVRDPLAIARERDCSRRLRSRRSSPRGNRCHERRRKGKRNGAMQTGPYLSSAKQKHGRVLGLEPSRLACGRSR